MGTYLVNTPEPAFNGTVGSIVFVDGQATVEGNLAFGDDGQPVLDEHTAPVEFHHMVRTGYVISLLDDDLEPVDADGDGTLDDLPNRSASTAVWRAFAVGHGTSQEEADSLSRDQLVEQYTSKETSA